MLGDLKYASIHFSDTAKCKYACAISHKVKPLNPIPVPLKPPLQTYGGVKSLCCELRFLKLYQDKNNDNQTFKRFDS